MAVDESMADDGPIQEFNQLSAEEIAALAPLADVPDPGWGQARDVPPSH